MENICVEPIEYVNPSKYKQNHVLLERVRPKSESRLILKKSLDLQALWLEACSRYKTSQRNISA